MNKDVIYIEPEDDITDILAKVKAAKNKIVALVPPKKAGVMRSAVNIKLIAKTAMRSNKTIVLISSDDSLTKLAMAASIPVAKTLQSKPQIPKDFSKPELGEEPSDVIEAKKPEAKKEEKLEKETKNEESEPVSEKATDEVHPPFKTAKEDGVKSEPKEKKEDYELSSEDLEEKKSVRGAKKLLPTRVPDFKKYLKWIILGGVALLGVIIFIIWANVIAPKADISVKIKTAETNFAEKVTFVTGEDTANAEEGIFYVEQKTVEKKVETEFEATGELDKGQKASGTIQVMIPAGTPITSEQRKAGASIGAGSVFVFGEIAYKAIEGRSITNIGMKCPQYSESCIVEENTSFGSIPVEAVENGDKYNIAAATSGWSLNSTAWYAKDLKFVSSEMAGGSSEMVKVVSKDDVEKAKTSITMPSDDQIREELAGEFDSDYLIIKSSLTASEAKYTSDPDVEGEVKDDKKPKLTLERSYTVYAVKRSDINAYITKKAKESIGDDTQTIYSTGVSGFEKKLTSNSDTSANAKKDAVFFDSFKNADGEITAKLKSVVLTAPEVSEEKILEIALGNKKNDVFRSLKSTKGISEVNIDVKPFSTIPKDSNRVTVTIELVK